MAAIARTPAAGEPITSGYTTSDGERSRLTPTRLDSFHARTPVGTEGIAGLLTGWVAVPRGSSQAPGAASDPAGMATVERAAQQRIDRFGLPQESLGALVDYFSTSGGKFPELSGGLGAGGGGYTEGNATTARPGGAAGAAGGLDLNMMIAIGAGALVLVLLLRRKGK